MRNLSRNRRNTKENLTKICKKKFMKSETQTERYFLWKVAEIEKQKNLRHSKCVPSVSFRNHRIIKLFVRLKKKKKRRKVKEKAFASHVGKTDFSKRTGKTNCSGWGKNLFLFLFFFDKKTCRWLVPVFKIGSGTGPQRSCFFKASETQTR